MTTNGAVPVAIVDTNIPAVELPVALSVVANTPVVPILPTLALPLALMVPVILAPADVTTNMFAPPPTLMLTLPAALGILKLLVPFDIVETVTPLKLKLPAPSVVRYCPTPPPAIFTFPIAPKLMLLAPVKLTIPVLIRFESVPILEILGWLLAAAIN